jgi:hypothetical protein
MAHGRRWWLDCCSWALDSARRHSLVLVHGRCGGVCCRSRVGVCWGVGDVGSGRGWWLAGRSVCMVPVVCAASDGDGEDAAGVGVFVSHS